MLFSFWVVVFISGQFSHLWFCGLFGKGKAKPFLPFVTPRKRRFATGKSNPLLQFNTLLRLYKGLKNYLCLALFFLKPITIPKGYSIRSYPSLLFVFHAYLFPAKPTRTSTTILLHLMYVHLVCHSFPTLT